VALLSLYRALIGREQQAPPLLGRDRDSYAGNKNRAPPLRSAMTLRIVFVRFEHQKNSRRRKNDFVFA
jgi:hypothetical protein